MNPHLSPTVSPDTLEQAPTAVTTVLSLVWMGMRKATSATWAEPRATPNGLGDLASLFALWDPPFLHLGVLT